MTATARLNREYALRLAGVGALMLGMTGWALYDGCVAYPRLNDRYEAVRPALAARNLTAGEWVKPEGGGASLFERAFAEAGMAVPKGLFSRLKTLNEQARGLTVPPAQAEAFRARQIEAARGLLDQPLKSAHDIRSQFVMAAFAAAAALACFVTVARKARRRFTADEAGLSGFGPATILYDDLAAVEWARWEDKRIVRFILRDGRKLTLDGWHYAGAEEFVAEVLRRRPGLAPGAAAAAGAAKPLTE